MYSFGEIIGLSAVLLSIAALCGLILTYVSQVPMSQWLAPLGVAVLATLLLSIFGEHIVKRLRSAAKR